jgi:hypothetical protein
MSSTPPHQVVDTPFVNEMRLGPRHWTVALGILALIVLLTPALWAKLEAFRPGPDYRVPYALSKDYWLYQRRLEQVKRTNLLVLGDSVIWGEYVRPDGTLPHFLSEQCGQPGRFVNGGVNGLFPLAFEGLIRAYGHPLTGRKVIVHCNLLWLSSPKADLHTDKEERFNHADLVPQFWPRIPCYRADLNQRLGAVLEQHVTFYEWASHLQIAYFGQKSILNWTLEEDGEDPPRCPNVYKNPLAQISFRIPPEPEVDPERGPGSPRHKPWSTTGEGTTRFDWVDLDQSLQWAAFQRLIELLRARGNDLLVVVGPFNEHMMTEDNRPAFHRLREGAVDWLTKNQIACLVPDALPSDLYADASHPLTEGYQLLAQRLYQDTKFQAWLNDSPAR